MPPQPHDTPIALPLVGAVYRGGPTIGARDGILEHLRGRRLLVVALLSNRDLDRELDREPRRPLADTDIELRRGQTLEAIQASPRLDDPDAIRHVEVRVTLRGRMVTEYVELAEWGGDLLASPAASAPQGPR